MRKTLTAIAVAGGLAFATPAMATDIIQMADLDGAGNPTGAFVTLDKLNTSVVTGGGTYGAVHSLADVGGANTLDNGDGFSETITLVTNSSQLAGGGTSFALGGDYRIEATLTGVVSNIQGTGITLNADGTVSGLATTTFDVNFNASPLSSVQLYNNFTNQQIAELDLTSGGASGLQLVAGTPIGDLTINAELGTDAAPFNVVGDTYILDEFGASLINVITNTITTGSVRIASADDAAAAGFAGVVFGDPNTNLLTVVFTDNGQTTTFQQVPTPAPLALLGLGLIGLAVRRKLA